MRTRHITRWTLAPVTCLSLAAAACSAAPSTPHTAEAPAFQEASEERVAPVDNTPPGFTDDTPPKPELACRMRMATVHGGILLHFEAEAEEVEQLRDQVYKVAELYDDSLHDSVVGSGPMFYVTRASFEQPQLVENHIAASGVRRIVDLDTSAVVEPTEEGAKLFIFALVPEQVGELQARVRWYAPDLLPGVLETQESCPTIPGERSVVAAAVRGVEPASAAER